MDYIKHQLTPQRRSINADLPEPDTLLESQTPLSERRNVMAKDTSFVERLELLKESPKTEDEVRQTKDVALVIEDTEAILKFGLKNSKQQQQIQNELKALLDHEQKIIQQIFDRAEKFKEFKDESKKSADKFEDEHNLRIPFYAQYLKQLSELPETENVTQDGMPKEVQAKILYNIVENTTHAANNTIVQLSMEKTLMNDMDLSMEKLRNLAAFMITNFQTWNKTIGSQEENLNHIMVTYNKLSEDVNKLKEAKPFDAESMKPDQVVDVMRSIEDRLKSLENDLKVIKCQTVCHERSPTTSPSLPRQKQRGHCIQPADHCGHQQACTPFPECPSLRNVPKRMNNCERPQMSATRSRVCVSSHSPEDRLHAGRDQHSSSSLSPPTAKCSEVEFLPYSLELTKPQLKPLLLNTQESCPQSHYGSPQETSYLHIASTPDSLETSQGSSRYEQFSSPNRLGCTQFQLESLQVRSSPEDSFVSSQPISKSLTPSKGVTVTRLTPNLQPTAVEDQYMQISPEHKLGLVEIPDIDFPLTPATVEQEGRPKVEHYPLTLGESPMTASSPVRHISR